MTSVVFSPLAVGKSPLVQPSKPAPGRPAWAPCKRVLVSHMRRGSGREGHFRRLRVQTPFVGWVAGTLELLELADDVLDSIEEKVLSDSECVESDAEDEEEVRRARIPALVMCG